MTGRARAAKFDAHAHRRQLGESIKAIRRANGWTQERLAEECVLDRSYLANIESGGRNPSLDILVKISLGLGVRLEDLVRGVAEPDHKLASEGQGRGTKA